MNSLHFLDDYAPRRFFFSLLYVHLLLRRTRLGNYEDALEEIAALIAGNAPADRVEYRAGNSSSQFELGSSPRASFSCDSQANIGRIALKMQTYIKVKGSSQFGSAKLRTAQPAKLTIDAASTKEYNRAYDRA